MNHKYTVNSDLVGREQAGDFTYVRPESAHKVWMWLPCDLCITEPTRVNTFGRRYCQEHGPEHWRTDNAPVAEEKPGTRLWIYELCVKCGNDPGPFSPLEGMCRNCKFGAR